MTHWAKAVVIGAAVLMLPAKVGAEEIVVFAAASLKTALDDIAPLWQTRTGDRILLSYAGTSTLARQIQQGAPADVFISASAEWMDAVEADGLIAPHSRTDLLANSLVLIAAPNVAVVGQGTITPDSLARVVDAAERPEGAALAIAFTDAVPAGIYAKAALVSLGVWDAVKPGVVETENVRAALALVARAEVPFGIVYATDVMAEPRVKTIGPFPHDLQPAIVYPAALTVDATPRAAAFLDYLSGAEAWTVFEAQGFEQPNASRP